MTTGLHPAIHADWLQLRRRGMLSFARMMGMPALLLSCCVALASAAFYLGYGWCVVAAALLSLGGSHAIAHSRLLNTLKRWRFGWFGALPVAPSTTVRTLFLVMAMALTSSLACVDVLLWAVSVSAAHQVDLAYALAGIDLGLIAGTLVAVARVSRPGAVARSRHVDGIREPLLALPWLNGPYLPHLLDWQRRAAVVRWRRGGRFVLVGVVLAGLPHGSSLPLVVALLPLVISWLWLSVVMRASVDTADDAISLLGAVALDSRRARLASLRYPLMTSSCALLPVVIVAILSRRGVILLGRVHTIGVRRQ
ncbi:MAG: hypothetical protein ACREPY_15925 [Rhodanobacteraceae bacterium]